MPWKGTSTNIMDWWCEEGYFTWSVWCYNCGSWQRQRAYTCENHSSTFVRQLTLERDNNKTNNTPFIANTPNEDQVHARKLYRHIKHSYTGKIITPHHIITLPWQLFRDWKQQLLHKMMTERSIRSKVISSNCTVSVNFVFIQRSAWKLHIHRHVRRRSKINYLALVTTLSTRWGSANWY